MGLEETSRYNPGFMPIGLTLVLLEVAPFRQHNSSKWIYFIHFFVCYPFESAITQDGLPCILYPRLLRIYGYRV